MYSDLREEVHVPVTSRYIYPGAQRHPCVRGTVQMPPGEQMSLGAEEPSCVCAFSTQRAVTATGGVPLTGAIISGVWMRLKVWLGQL